MRTQLRTQPTPWPRRADQQSPHERFANIFLRTDDFHDAIIVPKSNGTIRGHPFCFSLRILMGNS
jgi:hypothetical protein